MSKTNFLLVDLNEPKTKKLAETITSDTSRKILNHLTEKEDTEANIAHILSLPISTVHYHLQKLQEAGLVIVDEFHYSSKGREINHYKLANKYIIIAPQKVSGLREKLKGILPVAVASLAVGFVLKLYSEFNKASVMLGTRTVDYATETAQKVAAPTIQQAIVQESAAPTLHQAIMQEAAPTIQQAVQKETMQFATQTVTAPVSAGPDIALWFLIGSASTIVLYILFSFIKEKWKK